MDQDWMETGTVVSLPEGWFYDTERKIKFRLNEDGAPVDKDGVPISEQGAGT
jgi:hypothetical protein